VTHLIDSAGLPLLFLLVALESAGIPLPGETALIVAAVLAQRGHFDIAAVIVVAAAAAIIGDNAGYWAARKGGRRLLRRWSRLSNWSDRALPRAERFFERHGGKTVFVGRFIAFLRFTAAWLAGLSHMSWWRFFAWNAAGGIAWACLVGLVAYYTSEAAAQAIGRYGLVVGGGFVVLALLAFGALQLWRRHAESAESGA
jgi:membrane protein DedA with SNARE-associated domain